MLDNVSLGRYYPAHSFLHDTDPRVKTILYAVYLVAIFIIKEPVTIAVLAGVIILQLLHLVGVFQRVERKTIDDLPLLLIHDIIDIMVGPRHQPSARLQDTEAFLPDGLYFFYIAV